MIVILKNEADGFRDYKPLPGAGCFSPIRCSVCDFSRFPMVVLNAPPEVGSYARLGPIVGICDFCVQHVVVKLTIALALAKEGG